MSDNLRAALMELAKEIATEYPNAMRATIRMEAAGYCVVEVASKECCGVMLEQL